MTNEFQKRVLELVKKIPKGRVSTYKEVARALGNSRAFRAVGNALNKNPHLITIPCHRVVKSDGSIGGYAKGVKAKMKLLSEENVILDRRKLKILNFREILYKFKSNDSRI